MVSTDSLRLSSTSLDEFAKENRSPMRDSFQQNAGSSFFPRLVFGLRDNLAKLGVTVGSHPELPCYLESMACMIHESMGGTARNYHSVQHVFDLAEPFKASDPIAVLSAFWHDIVYYHVDGGLSDIQTDILQGVVTFQQDNETGIQVPIFQAGKHSRSDDDDDDDGLIRMAEIIFGYPAGQEVTLKNGLNEFLSAIIAIRQLKPLLPKPILAQILCCIEATIPFRAQKNMCENLFERLQHVNHSYELGLTEKDCIRTIQRAAELANVDVENFGTDDLAWFLDNAWSLLPESDKGLRRQNLYSVQQFQFAIFKLWKFYSFLQPSVIFPSFQNVPSSNDIAQRETNASKNLIAGRKYVGARLISLSVLSAVAELTGGDAPMALFIGDMSCWGFESSGRREKPSFRLQKNGQGLSALSFSENEEQSTTEKASSKNSMLKHDPAVLEVLSKGRRSETIFDVRKSPIAAHFYKALGDEGVDAILKEIQVYPMTEEVAWKLLRRLPRETVLDVIHNLSITAITRVTKIQKVEEKL